jgi:nitroreductase
VISKVPGDSTATTPVLAAIHHRRSIREGYDRAAIHQTDVERVVAAGLAAPSSKNSQPWRLHVVSNPAILAEIADDMDSDASVDSYVPHDPGTGKPRPRFRSTVHDSAAVLRQVPVAIFIENTAPFSQGSSTIEGVPSGRLRSALFVYGLEYLGIGAALQNMWLAAESLGLRGAFLGDAAIATPTVTRLLGLSGDFVGVLAIGRSASLPRSPMDEPDGDRSTRVLWHTRSTGSPAERSS